MSDFSVSEAELVLVSITFRLAVDITWLTKSFDFVEYGNSKTVSTKRKYRYDNHSRGDESSAS